MNKPRRKKSELRKKSKIKTGAYFGSGVLADGVVGIQYRLSPKVSANGIFTIFQAWGFPCFRHCFAIVTLFRMPKKSKKIRVSLQKVGELTQKSLFVMDAASDEDNGAPAFNVPLNLQFMSDGEYRVVFSMLQENARLSIPFEVRLKEWPIYTETEREYCRSNPGVVRAVRANVECQNCRHSYVFEEYMLDDAPQIGGVKRFPENGTFKCDDCRHILNLKDLQGQLRNSLKEQVAISMTGRT